ncbi:MAG TPA: single-stranded-DNA-specific exonuclease RecJ [Gammaproteobacteria bacterium]|nr:single-stranded-DNA-specific exonuclease RecJ [Gammaproteobacteria bacterium]
MIKKTIKRRTKNSIEIPHLHPLLHRVYTARDISSSQELERGLEHLLPFHTMLGMEAAVKCLAHALMHQEKILIIGDFDADGATSTAVAIHALKGLGAQHVDYLVPNRFAFGYGLTPELVQIAKDFSPDVIVTVDNGIASHAGVSAAKQLGIKVIVTDHHLPAETLPLADAIVNPNQHHDEFPSKNIAGVGVIFYVMLALRRYLSGQNWFQQNNIPEPNMSRLLDLVALGTVADVVSLDHNNRILVYQGLRRIRSQQCVPGITALLEISGRNQARVTASDLGFAVAPRLNAAGRLDDMSLGIECLLTSDLTHAREMAALLTQLNDERRVIEQDMQEQALTALNKIETDAKTNGICLFDEEWHQGVIGILAGRIKDRLHRPVIAFALANADELKGSARSIPGLHIRDVLADIAAKYPDCINKFGGHAMAAGLTLSRTQFENFSAIFNEVVSQKLNFLDLQHALFSDGELDLTELSLESAEILREAGPWGQSFPEPVFDGVFQILEQRLVGGRHLKLTLSREDQPIQAIAFNVDINQWPNYRCEFINIAYRLDVNEYRGKRSVQLIIEQLETCS